MANKAKSLMDAAAALFTKKEADKAAQPVDQQPVAERMVRQADPLKRQQASDSLKKAFGN